VELVPGREGFDELAGPGELLLNLALLLDLGDHRLELGQGLLRVAHGAVVLHELGVREAGLHLVVFAANILQFFEHDELSAGSFPLPTKRTLSLTATGRRRGRAGSRWGASPEV